MKYRNLLFDLDGTIIDPVVGITTSYQAALTDLGISPPTLEALKGTIGPPLRECFAVFLKTTSAEQIENAVKRYRHYYVEKKYMLKDKPYPYIDEVLKTLVKHNYRLFIATSKAHTYARDILQHFNLLHYFEKVYGSELDGTRGQKGELLHFLLDEEQIIPNETLMIGDRLHDVEAALANSVRCLGVSYGYGTVEELVDAGAYKICASPLEILEELQ